MFKAQDAMATQVVTLSPDATVEAAIRLLIDRHISGAPVVDAEGRVSGIVSEFQLLEVTYEPRLRDRRVKDFMTKSPITVAPFALLTEVVNLFIVHRIRRLPVVEDNRLVGIISRRDVLRCLIENSALDDAAVRAPDRVPEYASPSA